MCKSEIYDASAVTRPNWNSSVDRREIRPVLRVGNPRAGVQKFVRKNAATFTASAKEATGNA